MKLNHFGLVAFVGIGLLAGGCSNSKSGATGNGTPDMGGGGGGGGGIGSISDLQTALALIDCQYRARCGSIAAGNEKACEAGAQAALKNYPAPYDPAEAIMSKRVSFDAAAAKACADAMKAAGCTVDQYLAANQSCANVTKPLVMPGGMCKSSVECVGGYCDQGKNGSDGCAGTCKAYVATNAACDPNNPHCADSDYCDSKTMKCAARAASGATCGTSPHCQLGLFCHGYVAAAMNMPEKPGKCGGPGNAGDPCTSYIFGNTDCTPGLFCDDSLPKPICSTRLPMGAKCYSFAACVDGLDCIGIKLDMKGNVMTPGACKPYLDVKAACDASVDETGCPGDLNCDSTSKTCIPYGNEGADCSMNGSQGSCDDNLYCDGHTMKCTKAVALGAACTPPPVVMGQPSGDDPCHDGTCANNVCTLVCM